jgi:hypothetical protein
MKNYKNTTLQIFEFGEEPSDHFYCLVDLKVSPGGMDLARMKLADPRNLDQEFANNGCLLMLTGREIEELLRRKEIDQDDLHVSIYNLAEREGLIQNRE